MLQVPKKAKKIRPIPKGNGLLSFCGFNIGGEQPAWGRDADREQAAEAKRQCAELTGELDALAERRTASVASRALCYQKILADVSSICFVFSRSSISFSDLYFLSCGQSSAQPQSSSASSSRIIPMPVAWTEMYLSGAMHTQKRVNSILLPLLLPCTRPPYALAPREC